MAMPVYFGYWSVGKWKEGIFTKTKIKLLLCMCALALALTVPHTTVSAKTTKYYVDINDGVLNIRSKPNLTTSKIVGTLTAGQTVKVIGTIDQEWAAFTYNGKICYVSLQYLSKKKTSSSRTSLTFPATYVVNNVYGYINIRNKPNLTTSKVVATKKQGAKLKVIYVVNSEWLAIQYKSKVRYVFASYVKRK